MKNINSNKKVVFDKFNLGVYHGVKITLNIPNKNYKKADKANKYFLESYFNKKQRQYKDTVRNMYLDYLSSNGSKKLSSAQKLTDLKELFGSYIEEIIQKLDLGGTVASISLNTTVLTAIKEYMSYQEKQFEINELVDISDYRDRSRKLNDYFSLVDNHVLRIKDLNIDIWEKYRYFLLDNYKINSNSTVNQHIVYVKSFYGWLYKKEILIFNHPKALVKLKEGKSNKYKDIGLELSYNFIEALSIDSRWLRLYIVCLLVFENAKRPIQVYTLQHKNIDLDNRLLRLRPKGRNENELETTSMSEELANAIEIVYNNTKHINQSITDDCYLLGGYNTFKPSGSAAPTQGNIYEILGKFKKENPQFKHINIYDLKHTVLTNVSQKNPRKAQRMANHKSLKTTEIYDKTKQFSPSIPRKNLRDGLFE